MRENDSVRKQQQNKAKRNHALLGSHENQSKKRETTLSENRQIEEPRRDYGTEKLARPKTGRQNKRKVNHVALVSKESVSKDENQFADKAWTFITAHKEHE
jgi:hypothetical protein